MDFKKMMIESEESIKFKVNENQRLFESIFINDNYQVSIQASYGHYCKPKRTSEDFTEYTHMEILPYKTNGTLLFPDNLVEFEDYEIMKKCYCEDGVYGYVPVDTIQKLCDWLISK